MNSSEIRNKFLNFFKSKKHKIVTSSPIICKDDPSLMFVNAGMVTFKDYLLGNKKKLTLIAGLNILESEEQTLMVAKYLEKVLSKTGHPFIFKASFDKANRSSVNSYRGLGFDKSISIFKTLKEENFNLITDVHEINQIEKISEIIDIIQIPAFL